MTRGKARTPRTVRKLNIGGGGGSSQPPTGLPSFAKSTLEAYVKASNTGTGDGFGSSVAVDGNTLVVGAPSEDSNATGINGNQANNSASGSGAVYVFTRSNGVWTQQAYLKASNTGVQDHFGTSVALSGETLAVGAPDEDSNAMGINGNQSDNSAENSGAVYIFTRVNGEWHQQAYVKLSKPPGVLDPIEMDWMAKHWRFGASVALSGEILAVGAPGAELLSEENGAVYVFKRAITMVGGQPGVKWKQQAFVGSPLQGIGYSFGYSVALGGETLAAGDHSTNKQVHQCGAVHVFTSTNGAWTKRRSLLASNPGESDIFGNSVAFSGETLAVGAQREDSSATGIKGNQSDNSAENSGAVYVFTRSGPASVLTSKWGWKQRAYVKASNTEAGDDFGLSVAVSGDTLVVGAPGEDSNATGINGNQSDNSVQGSGAVYVYRAK